VINTLLGINEKGSTYILNILFMHSRYT